MAGNLQAKFTGISDKMTRVARTIEQSLSKDIAETDLRIHRVQKNAGNIATRMSE
jgi:hypothetical protein